MVCPEPGAIAVLCLVRPRASEAHEANAPSEEAVACANN
jgi:hypothetical protein